MEDVDHHFEIIEHDPLARRKTVDGCGASPMVLAQSHFNFVSNRLELRFGGCRADHEEIGEGGNSGEIEDDNVFSLFV